MPSQASPDHPDPTDCDCTTDDPQQTFLITETLTWQVTAPCRDTALSAFLRDPNAATLIGVDEREVVPA